MSEKKDGHRARSRSSSLSSSDEEYKNLTKEERREKKLQKKNQRRKDRSSSSSSSSSSCSSSSDEEYKNLPKDEKRKRKKEKKDMRRKQKGGKKKGSLVPGKEHKHHHPIAAAHAKKADVNVPSAQEEKGVKAYAEHDGQKDKPVDPEKDEQKEKHDDADSDTANKNATADDVNTNLNNRTDRQSLDKDAEDEKHEETQKEEITVSKGNEQIENKTLLKTEEETDNQNTEQFNTYQSNTDNDLFVMKSDDLTNSQDKNEEQIIPDDVKNTQDKSKEKNRSDDVTKTQNKNEETIRSDDVTNTQVKNEGNDVSNIKNKDTDVSDRKDATDNDKFDVENKEPMSSAKVDTSDLKHNSELTKDGETKSTERRNSDHDDGKKKMIKSDSDEKDSLNDKTVTFKPDNNDTGEAVDQKPAEQDEGPSQSTSFDDPPSIVDHTVENPKRIDEKHVEENEGSSQSTSFDDPPPIQTEVPSPSERDTKMAQSSESTDTHSRNKQENVLKWETPSDDEHEVGSRDKNVAEEDKNTETRKDISDKHGVDHKDEKDNDDVKSVTKSEDSIKINEDHENVSDDENEEERMKEKDDENQKPSARSEDTKHVVIAPEVKITQTKEKQKASTSNKGRQSKSPHLQYKQNRESPRQQNNRRTPEDQKFRRPIHSAPVTSKSGGMTRPKTSDGRRCISRGVKKQTKKKKQEESAEEASAAGKQKKEYKTEELKRLQEILKKDKSHIRKPKQRAHFPFVWTSLEPYYNTHTAAFLIDLQEQDEEDPKTSEPTISPREQKRPIRFVGWNLLVVEHIWGRGLCTGLHYGV